MMDLGTMQTKMDHREYRDLDQVEVSLHTSSTVFLDCHC